MTHYFETLLPAPPCPSTHLLLGAIAARRRFRPAVGLVDEAERLVRGWVERLQALGHGVGLQRRILSVARPRFVSPESHASLGKYGAFDSAVMAGSERRDIMQRLSPLLDRHVDTQRFEVVVRSAA